jgi:hypothetical protein
LRTGRQRCVIPAGGRIALDLPADLPRTGVGPDRTPHERDTTVVEPKGGPTTLMSR